LAVGFYNKEIYMCLIIDKANTEKLLKRLTKSKNGIICYKAVTQYGESPVVAPSYQYKPGINISNRKSVNLNNIERQNQCVYKGIHVCANKINLKIYDEEVCIPVRCYLQDFVMGGKGNEAVFTKVYINLNTYKKLFKL
jgi:hypothetical protein